MIDLYELSFTMDYEGFKDVWFCLFVTDSERSFDPDDFIPPDVRLLGSEDCSAAFEYTRGYIEELFTEEEKDLVKEYMLSAHGTELTIERADLPVLDWEYPTGAIPIGGNNNFIALDREPGYYLPFKVWMYYNLRGCEIIPEAITQDR